MSKEFKTGGVTGMIILFLAIYGFISFLSSRISFNWRVSLGILLVIFVLEVFVDLLEWRMNQ